MLCHAVEENGIPRISRLCGGTPTKKSNCVLYYTIIGLLSSILIMFVPACASEEANVLSLALRVFRGRYYDVIAAAPIGLSTGVPGIPSKVAVLHFPAY